MKYTMITGASSGIGYATAIAFAKRGKNLILVARGKERLEELKVRLLTLAPTIEVIINATDLTITQKVYDLYNGVKHLQIETLINNAGFGNYDSVGNQNLNKIEEMMKLNIEALTILSSLYVGDYENVSGSQLINVSSTGGYNIVSNAVTYCASKFYVSAFTEGLSWELKNKGAKLQAKVLAPSVTQTGFAIKANNVDTYDYGSSFARYHTSEEMAGFLLELYDGDKIVGYVDRDAYEFKMMDPIFKHV